jgi:hypothetical protein
MADVKIALEDLKEEPEVLAAPVAKRRNKWPVVVGSAVTLAVAAGGAWLLLNSKNVSAPPPVTQVTFDGRLAMNPTVSADGKYVAYASDRAGQGNLDIWVQALPTGQPMQFTKDEANEDYPSFSPDGTTIAFRSDRDMGGIYVMSILGGEPHLLARNPGRPLYSPDGKYVLCSTVERRGRSRATIRTRRGGRTAQNPGRRSIHVSDLVARCETDFGRGRIHGASTSYDDLACSSSCRRSSHSLLRTNGCSRRGHSHGMAKGQPHSVHGPFGRCTRSVAGESVARWVENRRSFPTADVCRRAY